VDLPSSEIVKAVYALLPGFLTAWVFYGLTAHPRQGTFERIVQALIFTGIVQAIVVSIRGAMMLLGRIYVIGTWTDDRAFVVSIVVATILGLVVALFANKDWFHKFLREYRWFRGLGGITTRTSFPSEWFSAFIRNKRYVVLHLKGDRRLYGWPYEWPDQPDSGHFVIMEPEWVLDDNSRAPVHKVATMIVPAKDVEMVEFLKFDNEVTVSAEELRTVEQALTRLRTEEKKHGRETGSGEDRLCQEK
jgi:hypothetical protein